MAQESGSFYIYIALIYPLIILSIHFMITLYDYLPSQNCYKVRLLLHHLQREYKTVLVSILEGECQVKKFLSKNPVGAVPVLELENGEILTESNSILFYLADGTPYLPDDLWQRSQVLRWMFFEEDMIQNGLATLRHWTLTDKLRRHSDELIEKKRTESTRLLNILENWFSDHRFLAADRYTIADILIYAYAAFGAESGLPMSRYPEFNKWVQRLRNQSRFLDKIYPYSIDKHSAKELP